MTRHLAIGDIHGCFDALLLLADFVGLREDDVIVTLGDYVDRGPDSSAVLDWLIHRHQTGRLRPLRGNHDIMMLKARDSKSEYCRWLEVGGDAALRSYAQVENDRGSLADVPEHHWHFLSDCLLPYFETETHFFVHANAYPDIDLPDQPDFMLYWEHIRNPPPHSSGKVMICGHTSQNSGEPYFNGHAACIDTWACGAGWLTCLEVESGKIWQANQRGQTRKSWLDEYLG